MHRRLIHRVHAWYAVGGLVLLLAASCGGDTPEAPAASGPSPTPDPRDSGMSVLFYSDRDGDDEVYMLDVDSGEVRQLTDAPGRDYEGAISPDGETIVFASQRETGKNSQLFLMDADGTNVRRFTFSSSDERPVLDDYPHFSPDGRSIVFQRATTTGDTTDADIWLIDVATGEERQLTNTPDAWDSTPSFTSDGSGVLFESDRAGAYAIYRLDLVTMETTRVTGEDAGTAYGGKDSPDGSRIMYTADPDGDSEVYIVDPDGSNRAQITNNEDRDIYPHWSADGSRILFESDRDGNLEIYVMNADGGDVRRLTDDPGKDGDPHWARTH